MANVVGGLEFFDVCFESILGRKKLCMYFRKECIVLFPFLCR